MDEFEKELISRVINMFIKSKGVEFLEKVPELHTLIKNMRDNMNIVEKIKQLIEPLIDEEKQLIINWMTEE